MRSGSRDIRYSSIPELEGGARQRRGRHFLCNSSARAIAPLKGVSADVGVPAVVSEEWSFLGGVQGVIERVGGHRGDGFRFARGTPPDPSYEEHQAARTGHP
ncbi:hypothetical protein PSm6_01240 [Pseudomonas solani]|uniref:Uncharacterized protein n=1 Tax=Pseudomonas solani TaxID=2731552 RepID=A0ABN6BKP5_9PSED|nr:hypothetical protein PSm6_01240 [Pseudomonas solani]